jgi:hypothetical protein
MITNHAHYSCVVTVPIWLSAHVGLGVLLLHNTRKGTPGDDLYAAALPFRNSIGKGCEYMIALVCNWLCYSSVVLARE